MPQLSHDLDHEKPVCIRIEGETLVVTPEDVEISISGKERVHWFLSGDGRITSIHFDDSALPHGPFHKPHLMPREKRHTLSECVVDHAHAKKQFKYTVHVTTSNGKQLSLDPAVNVMP
jgi:hypothetical protein